MGSFWSFFKKQEQPEQRLPWIVTEVPYSLRANLKDKGRVNLTISKPLQGNDENDESLFDIQL